MPFVFGASSASSPSSSPSAFTSIKFVPAGSPSASPSRGPSPATSPFSGRGGRGRGRGGYGGGEGGFDGGGRGRGGGTSPYQPKAKAGGYKALGNSGGGGGGQYRHHKRERVLGQWSDAVNYDRVKKVINVYLNEFQLKDRDLERFIVWFESADGGRRSLGWLLNMHAKGWDEETADSNDEQTTKSEASAESKKKSESDETSTKDSKPPGMNWHLQENQITDEGVKLLIAFAKRADSKVELRRFYLYKNIIGDDGAAAIASFVKESRSFVFEIHLSHNRLTIKGAQELFMATKEARVKPPRPLWLRLEWNYVSFEKAKKFLHDENITYCRVKDRLQCAPSKCARKPPPLLHLYVAELQYSESVGASSHLQMAKAKVKLAKEQIEKQNLGQDPRAFSREKEDSSAAAATSSVPAPAISKTTDAAVSEQSKPTVEAIGAGERKESAAMSAAARTPSRKPEAPTTTTTPAESKKAVGGSDEDLLRDVPTYIFLDTCAVLRMSEWRKGAKNIESDMAQLKSIAEAEEEEYEDIDSDDDSSDDDDDSEDEDEEMAAEQVMKIVERKVEKISSYTKTKKSVVQQQRQQQQKQQARGPTKNARANVGGGARDSMAEFPVFTFENLVERAKKGKFGENLAKPGDQVTLIITDTVMRELDHLKSSKPALIRNILSLQSDDGYLAKGVHLKFVEMLGAHQGEHLVALQDSSIVQSYGRKVMKGTSSLDNDRKIIDVALFWNSEIGVTGNVILLTADEGVREAAKRHNLPSDMWKNLDKRLFNALKRDPSAPWTASLLKSCMPGCMVKRDGKTMHLTPSVKPVQSIFQELDNALVLTYMLMEKMKALQAENRQLKDLIFDDVRSRVGAINAASPEALSGLADLQAVIAQHDEEQNGEEGNDDDEVDRLVAVTRERRRIWIEVLGQMAGPMSPLRMKSAESIWEGVKATSRRPGGAGSGLSQLMKTAEFLEVDDDDSSDDDDNDNDDGERAVYHRDDQEDQEVEDQDEEDKEAEAPAVNETEAAVEVDSSADSGIEVQVDHDSSASGAEAESASSGHEQAAEHTETTLHSTAEVEDEHEVVQEETAADVEDQPAVGQVLAEVSKTDINEEPESAGEHNGNDSAASALPQEASAE